MNRVAAILARNNVLLAPMAGVTEPPFRAICKRLGAGLTFTEMVSATALHYCPESRVSWELLTPDPSEVPCAVQLFGADPERIAVQARRIIERRGDQVCAIDINMGCPVSKVVGRGEGSGLMRTPELAAQIVARTVEETGVPVMVKCRTGWDHEEVNVVEFALAMEAAGASSVAVHGRTRGQFYQGVADWDAIARVKAALSIPVIGNGDVRSAEDVLAMFDRTGVDAVMIGRGAQGNPWIFREARALIDRGEHIAGPTPFERIDTAREHADALVRFIGEHAVVRMRKHVAWYVHGMPGATRVRARVNVVKTHEELDALLVEYRAYIASHPESVWQTKR